ncbi:glycine--tRNA ligase subunit beta [Granulicella mallensis]|uniref:Glycine--tRNA ligase beta subunit n=1 Tax=Granulicella mallensis TaxID=940614 RepID=A0A7W8ECC8_9BACT|nr:glycine--tRNA ligase subunit beta [Granulicella mallensis]MBB5066529.1 glycyl-tRNA synthetase beta chain [Granulicella mallensis]
MADFLLEIGLEEVPARMIAGAQAELLRRTLALLEREQLEGVDAVSYSTPRRLAVLVRGVREQQADITEEVTGPAVKIAFKDGVATPAAEAFARKSGVAVADLRTITTPKGEYLAATSVKKGRSAAEVLASELPKEIAGIYWAKNMYWRPGKPERFVRPVLWIVCLLGDAVVPLTFAGKTAGRASYGHRVLSSGEPFEIVAPESYLAQLEGEYVIADVEARRQKIRKALDHVTRAVEAARWREDEELVDSVTHLTEWPAVLLGGFEPAYLELPEEVLVTVMRDHQKYFAVEDAQGKLAPHFLAVLNIALDETNEPIIKQGNERVLRARFNDARFFWEFDQRTPLTERVKLLENVTFQKDLGSYATKSERVRSLAAQLAKIASSRGAAVDASAVDEAATLAKTDLTTELVKEFTELQGVIGGLYAKAQGASATVADAIYDQYLPASAKDSIPRSAEGALLGLADRIDTISGMFALGMEPTGSKDPFALRRAANSVVRILAESGLPLTLADVLGAAQSKPEVAAKLQAFFAERIEFYLREGRGQAYDVVKAVVAAGSEDLRDAVARAEAVTAVRGGEDFIAVSAAFKRMKNILDQAQAKGESIPASVNTSLLSDDSEKALESTGGRVAGDVEALRAKRQYREALTQVASLRPVVNEFFERVMVMAPEADIRANRLALLARTVADFSRIADFSEIVAQG